MKRSILYRAFMVLFDIFAVNFAYWFALILRFYIHFEFKAGAEQFISVWARFAPIYTIAAIVIFAVFDLYNTMWQLAGIRDLNRVIYANVTTTAFHVAVSLVTKHKMPLSVYFIGPVLQFCMIAVSRFGIKLVLMERAQAANSRANKNVMIIGMKYLSHAIRDHITTNNNMRVACMVDTINDEKNRSLNGIPVIGGTDEIEAAIEKYKITHVIIADTFLSEEKRKAITKTCEDKKIELQDYTGYIQNSSDVVSLVGLLQKSLGPVSLVIDGEVQNFEGGEKALLSVTGKYRVKSISGDAKGLTIRLENNPLSYNNLSEGFVQELRDENGEEVSFF